MKTSSKTRLILVALMIAGSAAPYAADATSATAQAQQALAAQNMCTKVQSFGQTALANITSRANKLQTDAQNDASKRLSQEQQFDQQVATDRAHWDQVRDQNFTKLNDEATTSAEKAAVGTFEQTVLADVTTRRSTVDSARDTFRATVTQDASAHLNALMGAISTFESSVTAAVSAAEANCSTGSATQIRTTFVAALKVARMTMQSSVSSITKLAPQVTAAGSIRTQAVQSADATFSQDVQAAASTLKSALGQS